MSGSRPRAEEKKIILYVRKPAPRQKKNYSLCPETCHGSEKKIMCVYPSPDQIKKIILYIRNLTPARKKNILYIRGYMDIQLSRGVRPGFSVEDFGSSYQAQQAYEPFPVCTVRSRTFFLVNFQPAPKKVKIINSGKLFFPIQ